MLEAKQDMAEALLGMGKTHKEQGDYKQAISVYDSARAIFHDIGADATYDLKETYEGISESYSKLKDFDNAFHYQAMLIAIKDTLYNLDVDKKLSTKLFTFTLDKKQGEIN